MLDTRCPESAAEQISMSCYLCSASLADRGMTRRMFASNDHKENKVNRSKRPSNDRMLSFLTTILGARKIVLPLVSVIGVVVCTVAEASVNPAYQVNSTETPPTIDGVVSPGEWADADPAAGDFTPFLDSGPIPVIDPDNNRFQLTWDRDNLYFLFQSDFGSWSPSSSNSTISFDGESNLDLYFDPNLDGEVNEIPDINPVTEFQAVDGYQLGVSQRTGFSEYTAGNTINMGLYFEAHLDTMFQDQGGWNPGWPTPNLSHHAAIHVAQNNGATGGVTEMSIPWTEFNAPNNPADGLFHPFAPSNGDTWFFQVGAISINNPDRYIPRWSDNDDRLFAARPHGVITFVPEPTSLVLLVLGGVSLLGRHRRKQTCLG